MTKNKSIAIAIAFACGIFILDIQVPIGYAVYLLYLIPIVIAAPTMKRLDILFLPMIGTLLTIASFFLEPPGGNLTRAMINRGLGVLALWSVSFLIMRRRQAEDALELSFHEMERRVVERTAELQQTNQALQLEIFERKQAQSDFEALHNRLEERVRERTTELENVNNTLLKTNAELSRLGEELAGSRQQLINIIDFFPDATFVIDSDKKVIVWNSAMEAMSGVSKAEMLGQGNRAYSIPFYGERRRQLLDLLDETDEELAAKYEAVRKKGDILYAEAFCPALYGGRGAYIWATVAPLVDSNGNRVGAIESIRDITDRRQTQLALEDTNSKLQAEITERERMEAELFKAQKIESLGVLAGGIAHDFNNLLTTVMGNVSLALLDLDSGHLVRKPLTEAERALLRAQELTQQLLTFSKGGTPVKRAVSIGELVRESTGFALRGSRIRCEFVLPDGLWFINADEGQISQVIHNLALNADQAMPEGGTIKVRCENTVLAEGVVPRLSAGRYVKVTIEDSGIGISPEHLLKIFDPYFSTKQRGSGLGLATTYSIVLKHGGHIAVASEIGVGTIFTLYLPASGVAREDKQTDDARQLPKGSGAILVMDDEADVRQTTGAVLRRLGYTVAFAEDGNRAIELYRKAMEEGRFFDLVIMDLTIPGGMGGREALQRLLEIDPAVKAIVSSGYSNDPIMAEYHSYGFAGIVAKPFRIKELSEAISRVIARNSAAIP